MINVFISRPSKLPKPFEQSYGDFHSFLEKDGLSPRRLGSSDYSLDAPLQAIIRIMSECSGAIVLGYPQIEIHQDVRRTIEKKKDPALLLPTPWNQIEGSLAYGAKLPVLVIAHPSISGGIFDHGITGQYVFGQDLAMKKWHKSFAFSQVYAEWKSKINNISQEKKTKRSKLTKN